MSFIAHIQFKTHYVRKKNIFYFYLSLPIYKMKRTITYILTVLGVFIAQASFSQDVSRFSNDKNKFSIGFELSGAFPVGSFSNINISFPCNSVVSTASAYEMSLGYQINTKLGLIATLSEGLFSLDPSSSGASQLIVNHPGLYQNVGVLKSGQLVAQSVMIGGYYDLPISKNGKIFLKSRVLLGIIGCSIPEIEIQGFHAPGAADKNGNSIDTIETWDTPKIYSYSFSYRADAGIYYSLNSRFEVFINLHYQGSSLTYSNVPASYNLTVNSNNASSTTILTNNTHLTEVNPVVSYQAISVGLGFEVRF